MKYIFYAIWMLWDVYVMRRKHYKTVLIKGFKAEHKVVQIEGYKNYALHIPGVVYKYKKWFPMAPAPKISVTERDGTGKAIGYRWELDKVKEPAWYLNFVRIHLKSK